MRPSLFPVADLLKFKEQHDLLCINQHRTVRDALALMTEKKFSQLPIIDDEGNLVGMISERSITYAYYERHKSTANQPHPGSLLDEPVMTCCTKPVTLPPQADFSEALAPLEEEYAIIIVQGMKPIGIVTDYDTAHFFNELTGWIIDVNKIEEVLREAIHTNYHLITLPPDLNKGAKKGVQQYYGSERGMLGIDPTWVPSLGTNITLIVSNWQTFAHIFHDKSQFETDLATVNDLRDRLAHFRGHLTAAEQKLITDTKEWVLDQYWAAYLAAHTE
jgi:CBS domain-containing protein